MTPALPAAAAAGPSFSLCITRCLPTVWFAARAAAWNVRCTAGLCRPHSVGPRTCCAGCRRLASQGRVTRSQSGRAALASGSCSAPGKHSARACTARTIHVPNSYRYQSIPTTASSSRRAGHSVHRTSNGARNGARAVRGAVHTVGCCRGEGARAWRPCSRVRWRRPPVKVQRTTGALPPLMPGTPCGRAHTTISECSFHLSDARVRALASRLQ